jgi:hypothetical protein
MKGSFRGRILRSTIIGLVFAILGFVVTFALARFFDTAFLAYVAPAGILVRLIGPLIPWKAVYWLVPDGGASAGVLLIGVSALFFWTIVFGVCHFAWVRLKRGPSDSQ